MNPTRSKVMDLAGAVGQHVRPGMALHLAFTRSRPNALIYELLRQFRGRDAAFTVSTTGLVTNGLLLIQAGLVCKLIAAVVCDDYPNPSPNPLFQHQYRAGAVELELWSVLTLVQRLKAAAMGLPFLPTRSLQGSGMAQDNRDTFKTIADPFGGADPVGLVRAWAPDLTFIHAVAADPDGNAVLSAPYGEDVYGAAAARGGAIVSVERIVSPAELRRYGHLVRLPAECVAAVVEVPYGAHPSGVAGPDLPGVQPYAEDGAFIAALRDCYRHPAALQDWMDEWVYGVKDQAEYLARLGPGRLRALRGAVRPPVLRDDPALAAVAANRPEPNPTERMVLEAARRVQLRAAALGATSILAGAGTGNVAAWLAGTRLEQAGHYISVMAEIGMYGFFPEPGDAYVFSQYNVPGCRMLSDVETALGILTCGAAARCIGVLGAAQVDRHGNLNSTFTPDGTFIVGSGGANDVATGAVEVLAVVPAARRRYVPEVDYVTSPGAQVRTVVSHLGVLEKPPGQAELVLTGYFGPPGAGPAAAAVARMREKCGWDLQVAPGLAAIPAPASADLLLIRLYDPAGALLGEALRAGEGGGAV